MNCKKDFFFCYNKRVSDFMYTKGIEYITVARDVKTQKIFSLYQITQDFKQAMDEYKQNQTN